MTASVEAALLFAAALERACTRALGEAVAAVILHGSLTLADYVPGSSDVDLLAVVDEPLTDAQLAALTAAVRAEATHASGRVDLRLVTRQAAAAPTPAPPLEASIAEWVLAVGDAQLADWEAIGDDPPHAQLTVLTACRVWRFAEERCHCSKTAAGEWALRRDPALQAVRDALRQRRTDPTVPIDAAQVRALLALVRARLAEPASTDVSGS